MRKLLSILLLLPIGIISSAVYAQNNELVLEEVVVTATKKEENVQSIAQTVNAVTGADIDDYQIRELGELSQLVSGVEFTQIDPADQSLLSEGKKLILTAVMINQFKPTLMKCQFDHKLRFIRCMTPKELKFLKVLKEHFKVL